MRNKVADHTIIFVNFLRISLLKYKDIDSQVHKA